MDYIVLYRESNKFNDVLTDTVLKKGIRMKMSLKHYLILTLANDKDAAYLMLRYGDDVISMSHVSPDRTPIPGKDYVPERKNKS